MYKTFAAKYKSTFNKMAAKYEKNGVFTVEYDSKSGTRYREFYHDGFSQKTDVLFDDIDTLPERRIRYINRPNSLAARLKAGVCEMCGTEGQLIHMRHVKRLKDLKGKDEFENLMMAKRRKSLALCPDCFEKAHACN